MISFDKRTTSDLQPSSSRFSAEQSVFYSAAVRWAREQPDAIAYRHHDTTCTYAQLNKKIQRWLQVLHAAGIKPGDRILSVLPMGPCAAALLLAGLQAGAVIAPCSTLSVNAELESRMELIQPKLVIVESARHASLARNLGFAALQPSTIKGAHLSCLFGGLQEQQDPDSALTPQNANCRSLIIFTSGSTARPKAAMLSEENLIHAITSFQSALNVSSKDTLLAVLPIDHIYGINTGILLPLFAGATTVIMDKFNAKEALCLIEEQQVTIVNGVPAMYKRITAEQESNPRNISSLNRGTIGGGECSDLVRYRNVLEADFRIVYGLTECPIIALTQTAHAAYATTVDVGTPARSVTVRIVDAFGKQTEPGQVGELVAKSPGAMIGYMNDPEATARMIDSEGWLHTGDLGCQDASGHIHIIGRLDDVINRGGYKIYPAELESLFSANPDLIDCAVTSLPHRDLGQQIVLFAEKKPGREILPAALRLWGQSRVAKNKLPDQIIIVNELPHLPNGKIDRCALRAYLDQPMYA